jgi:TolB-like protein/Flp pilus assembly protein TadD
MLAKDKEKRPRSMKDVAEEVSALRRGELIRHEGGEKGATLAVLSFQNITRNPEDDWLGTGVAETITSDLKGVEGLSLVPRERVEEVLKLRGLPGESSSAKVARQLRAAYVIEGGYQRMGDSVRMTAQVVSGGSVTKTVKIDGTMPGIFDLQDRMVRELCEGLTSGAGRVADDETDVVEAYEAYSRGLVNLKVESHESLDRAILFFERAVQKDPDYARAHLQLGTAVALKAQYLGIPDLYEKALLSLRRALELRGSLVEAWSEIGTIEMHLGRPDEGLAAIERALAQDPADADAHASLARIYFIGKADFAAAARAFERSLSLNPQAGWSALQLSHCCALLRAFPRGERAARRAITLQEEFLSGRRGIVVLGAHMRLGHLFALQGRPKEARQKYDDELAFEGRLEHALKARTFIEIHSRIGAAALAMGDSSAGEAALDMALEAFERRVRLGSDDPFSRFYAAAAYALKGDSEKAMDSLEKAAQGRRAFTLARARIEPEFVSLRSSPRFRTLLETP